MEEVPTKPLTEQDPEFAKSNEIMKKKQEEEIEVMNSMRKRWKLTDDEVKQYDQELRCATFGNKVQPFSAGPGFIGDLLKIAQAGFNIADKLLTAGNLIEGCDKWKKVVKDFTYIFDWGKAIYGILELFKGDDESQKDDAIKKELAKIADRLDDIEETIRQGFKDLIAHSDFAYFREKIATPAQTLFDRMQRCQRSVTETSTKDFLDDCSRVPPGHLLTTIFTFLDGTENGIRTQLEANAYSYETFKRWADIVNHTVVQLSILNMFYYGIRLEHEKKSESEKERFEEGEEEEMIFQLNRIQKCLGEIDLERVKSFIPGKNSQELFKKVAAQAVKEVDKGINQDQMNALVEKIKEGWEKANGIMVPFTVIVWAGRMNKPGYVSKFEKGFFKFAQFYSYDKGVIVVEDLYDSERQEGDKKLTNGEQRWENLNLALIQPVSEKMVDFQNNKARDTRDANRLMGKMYEMSREIPYLQTVFTHEYVEYFFKTLPELERKPLLILYNNKPSDNGWSTSPEIVYDTKGQDAVTGTEGFKLIPLKFTFTKKFMFGYQLCRAESQQIYFYVFFQEENEK